MPRYTGQEVRVEHDLACTTRRCSRLRGGGAGGKRSAVIESQPPYIGAYIGVFIGVPTGVTCTVLLFGERRDELAAEGRDIPDHAAPDGWESGRETAGYVSEGLLGRPKMPALPRLV
jgi:hypothetical protein